MRLKPACCVLMTVCAAAIGTAHAQQAYPVKPVRIIAAAAPGGGADITARILAPKLAEFLGQPVIVDNRPGAATVIGTTAVARAAPDGYTLLMALGSFTINPSVQTKLPYDTLKDFTAVTQVAEAANFIVVHPSLPAKTLKEFIAFARTRPGQLHYASSGVGGNPHLTMELFLLMTKLKLTHVPYKGVGPGITDLVAGHVQVMLTSILSTLNYVNAGRLRALAVTGARRSEVAPEVPTVAEAGVPGYEATQWFGVIAPAGTPSAVIARLHGDIVKTLKEPDVRKLFLNNGATPVGSTPDAFAAFLKADIEKWAKVVKAAGVKPDQ